MVYEQNTTNKEYPVYTVQKKRINNDAELDQWFSSWNEKYSSIYFSDFSLVGRWSYIFDSKIDEWIMRYNLLKTNNINSFSNLFEELPAIWVEVLGIINQQFNLAMKDKSNG